MSEWNECWSLLAFAGLECLMLVFSDQYICTLYPINHLAHLARFRQKLASWHVRKYFIFRGQIKDYNDQSLILWPHEHKDLSKNKPLKSLGKKTFKSFSDFSHKEYLSYWTCEELIWQFKLVTQRRYLACYIQAAKAVPSKHLFLCYNCQTPNLTI